MTHEHAHPHPMTSAQDVLMFATAGNARLTIVSKATGARFTYRLRSSEDGKVTFVGLLTGSDNESAFTYIGVIKGESRTYTRTAKVKISEDAPSIKAFTFFWRHLIERQHLHEGLEVWHEGRCGRCARVLTVPESIARGIGPDCAEQMGLDMGQPELASWARDKGQREWRGQ